MKSRLKSTLIYSTAISEVTGTTLKSNSLFEMLLESLFDIDQGRCCVRARPIDIHNTHDVCYA
jgi:hypothetical protein